MTTTRLIPLDQLQPKRICLIKPSALGDIVQTLPILSALRRRFPEASISWVVNKGLAGILAGHPDLKRVIPFDRTARGIKTLTSGWRLFRRLRHERFDVVLDLQGLLRSGVMARATSAPRRIGFSDAREGAAAFYTDVVNVTSSNMPAMEKYWLMAEALGCRGPIPPARLGLTDEIAAWAQAHLAPLPRPIVAIHPGAQWETKRWPTASFLAVAQRIVNAYRGSIVLLGGPGERVLCEQIAENLTGPVLNLAEQTSLLQLAAVEQGADLFLSGDTGPMHLAAAMGTHVVSIFTCTNPRRAGPHGQGHRIVATEVPCAASYWKKCPSLCCMQDVTTDKVWRAVQLSLGENPHEKYHRAG